MFPSQGSHELLRAHVFDAMTDEEIDALAAFMLERRLVEGQTLFREGEAGGSLFVIMQGEMNVSLRGPRGELLPVAQLTVGDLVGEQCCLEPGLRSATIVAASRVVCLELTHDALHRMLFARPRVASQLLYALLEDLTERVRDVELRIAEIVDGGDASSRPSSSPGRPSKIPSSPPLPGRSSSPPSPPSSSPWERLRSHFGASS